MDPYIGKLLDNRYEILERIGVGGMAMVYKARCHRLNRLVAIKILREDLAQDGEFRRRFHDESKAVAMLSHPNIVAVYDVSRSSTSEYIVMELIDGITLKQYIKEKNGVINWREALHFIIQIIKALGHAHSRGIIHRDIKPHNIMVLRDGSVKVADFGIARLIGGAHSTLTQEALGSVHYISPEQAKGSRIDARSDLYSAGVVLYEMITGRLPFEGDSPVSVAIQHINSIPLTPREVDPELPEALEAITMKAMASNVDNRYSSADDMLESLEEFRKNPSINFDYKMETLPPPTLDPGGATQVLTPVAPKPPAPSPSPSRKKQTKPRKESRLSYEDEDYDYGSQAKKKNPSLFPWGILAGVLAIFLFIGGVLFFLYNTFFSQLSPLLDETITYNVPSLVGRYYEDILIDSLLIQDFQIIQSDAVTDDKPKGTILSQDPAPNEEVTSATTPIYLTISDGPEIITMIDVSNQEYIKAQVELRNMGLSVGSPTYEFHETVAYNNIISFTPAADTHLQPGDVVHLVVSKGPEEKKVTLPNFIGESQSWAESKLGSMSLLWKINEQYSDTVAEGKIMDQYPVAGTEVPEGTEINLQISLGVDPNTLPQSVLRTITVDLPEVPLGMEQTIQVQVTMDDRMVYTQDVDPAHTASVSFEVEGSGVKVLSIYFDGVPAGSQTVNFDE